jgi:hypothetical protein
MKGDGASAREPPRNIDGVQTGNGDHENIVSVIDGRSTMGQKWHGEPTGVSQPRGCRQRCAECGPLLTRHRQFMASGRGRATESEAGVATYSSSRQEKRVLESSAGHVMGYEERFDFAICRATLATQLL